MYNCIHVSIGIQSDMKSYCYLTFEGLVFSFSSWAEVVGVGVNDNNT